MIHFSIVIPLYNASGQIRRTLDSCVSQSYLPSEIIIVDDQSSDDSMNIIKAWENDYHGEVTIVIEQLPQNSGPAAARNRGWDLATGEYLAFLDADDRFVPEKLKHIVPMLENDPHIILLMHAYILPDKQAPKSTTLQKVSSRILLLKNLSATGAIIIKRSIPERFDESMRFTEDHDLWLRVTQAYDQTYHLDTALTIIDRPVRSSGGQSANVWAMRKGEIRMYKKYCKSSGIMILFPLFAAFSLSKHLLKLIKGDS
ncbi:MAG TPA: glycosyltransferase family 2 protein [Epsilonproteobacteria bacterium]|nr:glycosyltransferase family 2 protein [Campylobacterota bacterium]